MNISELYEAFVQSTGVCTDTRQLRQGQLFVALKGPNFNGNAYAAQALQAGASAVVVDEPDQAAKLGDKALLVDSGYDALQALARHHRRQWPGRLFALTGSNGKTSTKELVARVLATKYKVLATEGNLNNEIGVPLTLLKLTAEHQLAVVEMGARRVGDIALLCGIAEPDMGLITNIGKAHLETFGGYEGVLRGKSELFDWLLKVEGDIFVNQQDPALANMAKRMPLSMGYPQGYVDLHMQAADPYVRFTAGGAGPHQAHLSGAYNFLNIAAALAVGKFLGVDQAKAIEAVCSYTPDNWRSQLVDWRGNTLIMDAYNANPDSMAASLENLKAMQAKVKWAVLGGMNELGPDHEKEHRAIGQLLAAQPLDQVVLVGQDAALMDPGVGAVQRCADAAEAITFLRQHCPTHAAVLVKASRSYGLEKLLDLTHDG